MQDEALWKRLRSETFFLNSGTTLAASISKFKFNATNTFHSRRKVEQIVEEYRAFLYLAATTQSVAVPSPLIATVWEKHQEDPRAYQATAERIGRFIQPLPAFQGQHKDAAYEATRVAYACEFGNPPPEKIWPSVAMQRWGYWQHKITQALFLLCGGLFFFGYHTYLWVALPALVVWVSASSLTVPWNFNWSYFIGDGD